MNPEENSSKNAAAKVRQHGNAGGLVLKRMIGFQAKGNGNQPEVMLMLMAVSFSGEAPCSM